jgi:hypothetical protein
LAKSLKTTLFRRIAWRFATAEWLCGEIVCRKWRGDHARRSCGARAAVSSARVHVEGQPTSGPRSHAKSQALRRSALCFGVLVLALGCGPKDRVGQDYPSGSDVDASSQPSAGSAARQVAPAGDGAAPAGASGQAGAPASAPDIDGSMIVPAADGGVAHVADSGDAGAALEPRDAAGDAAVSGLTGAQDAQCDLNGIWIARLTTFSRDTVFDATQTASNWYYYELSQTGVDVTVVRAIDCGIQVSGSADVTINAATTQALLHRNDQAGRHGQFYKDTDHCVFSFERFYSTRGVPRATYLPADTSNHPELSSLSPALPTEQSPAGSEDWDADGNPGIAFNVSGLGSRHVVQRDWNEFFSDASQTIALSASEFVARANFDSQEEILSVTGDLGALLQAGSTPALDMRHRILFHRLGQNANAAAVMALRVSDDLETCYNVQDALPHDSAME